MDYLLFKMHATSQKFAHSICNNYLAVGLCGDYTTL